MDELEQCDLWRVETIKVVEELIDVLTYCFRHTKQIKDLKQYEIAKSNRDSLKGLRVTLGMCTRQDILALRRVLKTEDGVERYNIIKECFGKDVERIERVITLTELLSCLLREN